MGYDYEFESPLDKKYECPICLLCQTDPVQTICGHRFCRNCIHQWLKRENRYCPEDNLPLQESNLFQDNCARREILQLRVKCPFSSCGCQETCELGTIQDHESLCEYKMESCPLSCGESFSKALLGAHTSSLCPKRLVRCTSCDLQLPYQEMENHGLQCGMVVIECDHCLVRVLRRNIDAHLTTECPMAVIACEFWRFGCDVRVIRQEMASHIQEATSHHLGLMCVSYKDLCNTIYHLGEKVDQFGTEKSVGVTSFPASSLSRRESQTRAACSPTSSPKPERKDTVRELSCDLNTLDVSDEMPEKALLKVQDIIQNLGRRTVTLEQQNHEAQIKIRSLQSEIDMLRSSKGVCIQELEHRFCNGTLLWKVSNFWQFALSRSENSFLFSPGFYTSSFGYKVCVRLGILVNGNDKHVSLYFHLMKGDFDDYLDWPFQGQLTIYILDQSDSEKKHIVESMTASPEKSAFQKPLSDRNMKGFGFNDFCSVHTLLSGGYVKDDSLALKAIVEAHSERNL